MKKNLLLITIVSLFLFSCAGKKKIIADTGVHNGSSFKEAVVINETHERQGIGDEYIWIRANYQGSRTNSQALVYHDKKPYDLLHITTADGKAVTVYFDISNFYGKL